ncbi:EAL domain-containing protein [Rhizobium sp. G21]|uniref:EAL domain-containing protein n=1 Tax=Rhizobium sp. G21 TaxID=2758439 RepID=UPI001FEF2225|nr:EAL domain-containing protein [Rhizobium sp. G21]
MISQAFRLDETTHSGHRPKTRYSAPISNIPNLSAARNVAVLQRIDIFGAVWQGSVRTTLAPRFDIASRRISSVELLNCLHHPDFGVVDSTTFLPCLNSEQARTLFLCDLAYVQEKLRIGSNETRELLVDIPTSAAALSTLGSEIRIIAQHTPDLFRRLELTLEEKAVAALSQDQTAQLRDLTKYGLRFTLRCAGQGAGGQIDLPFQAVRIDAAVTRGISKSADQLEMMRVLVADAARLGARVIVDGVDHAADLMVVRRETCGEAQGDLFGAPAGIEDFRLQLAERPETPSGYRTACSSR